MSPAVSQMSPQYVRLSGEVADQAIVLGTRQSAFPCDQDWRKMKMIRMVRRGFLAVFGLVLPGRSRICNEPFQQPLDANAIGLVADSASPSI